MSSPPLASAMTRAPEVSAWSRNDEKSSVLRGWATEPDHLAAGALDEPRRLGLEAAAEGIVGGDEEPGLVAALGERRDQRIGLRPGVVGPLHRAGRALRPGQRRRAAGRQQNGLVLAARHLVDRQGDRRVAEVGDRIDPVLIEPLARDRGADIGLVLMVGGDDLDALAGDLAAEILGGELRGDRRAAPRAVGKHAGLVVENSDLDDVVGRDRVTCRCQQDGGVDYDGNEPHCFPPWRRLCSLDAASWR